MIFQAMPYASHAIHTQHGTSESVPVRLRTHLSWRFRSGCACARQLEPRTRFATRLWIGKDVFNDPPGCETLLRVHLSVCLCRVMPGCSRSPQTKTSPVQERGSLQSVNNFQRGVTLNGKAFSTLSTGNWTII